MTWSLFSHARPLKGSADFQLHRVFHALDAILSELDSDEGISEDYPERLALGLDDLKLVHFSGHLKMWDLKPLLCPDPDYDKFAQQVMRDCGGDYYCRLWLDRTGEAEDWRGQFSCGIQVAINNKMELPFAHRITFQQVLTNTFYYPHCSKYSLLGYSIIRIVSP